MWLSLLLGSYASSAQAQSQADPTRRHRRCDGLWVAQNPRLLVELVWSQSERRLHLSWLARLGFSQSKKPYDWQLELALPLLLNLPSTAVAPPPQGQLGLGATYLAANDGHTNTAALFLKQGFVRVKGIGGIQGQSLTIGRMEFNDGTEVTPTNVILAALKRDRISQRLLGTFGYSDVGRSLDGAQYRLTSTKLNVTVLGGRATQGVFQVDGWPELKVTILES